VFGGDTAAGPPNQYAVSMLRAVDDGRCWNRRLLAARRPKLWRAQNWANAVAGSRRFVETPRSPKPGGERREEEGGSEADTAVLQADCVQLCCYAAAPPQPMLACTEDSLRADSILASDCSLVFSCSSMRENCQLCIVTLRSRRTLTILNSVNSAQLSPQRNKLC
jgi:hypothetical protein